MKERFKLKDPYEIAEFRMLEPAILAIFAGFLKFAESRDLPVTITSVIRTREEDEKLGAHTRTHQEGRAIDISARGWVYSDIQDCIDYMNDNYSHIGAISDSDKLPKPMVYHRVSGGVYHIHLQSRPESVIKTYTARAD